ncbi:hypothetical protein GAYE_HTGSCF31FUTG100G0369 [Galdieria yellowstonensis]|uniref:Resolvase/invertase-type recombinase catalytic domain-containing protein n=1 Tax=Galdieria yellowstonensis TaxID=3028027 RepID=A0AAV9I6E0_9RHOD|nr:hypothetical protein GAYE_HTGSCF31FUTG100G0369 [Galdieria yellowstonensis]
MIEPNNIWVYYRISTNMRQDFLRQMSAVEGYLKKHFPGKEFIVREEVASGMEEERRVELKKIIDSLQKDDLLVVASLDRIARNTFQLLKTLETISKKGACFIIVDNPELNTTSPHGKLVVSMLSSIAEFEYSLIRARCKQGLEAAKKRGVKFGRKPSFTADQIIHMSDMMKKQDTNVSSLARTFNTTARAIYRYCKSNGELTPLGEYIVTSKYKNYINRPLPPMPRRVRRKKTDVVEDVYRS